MLRKLLATGCLAVAAAAPAHAQPVPLMPGITYEKQVQFTSHRPVGFTVVTGPPSGSSGGLYSLGPALAGGTIRGARERVADLERDVSGTSTAVGVNGDFTSSTDGHANGIVVSGAYQHGPSPARSSVAIDSTGRAANVTLRVETTLGTVVATSHPHRSTAGRSCSPGTGTPRTGRPPPRRLRRPRHGRRPGWDH